MTRPLVPCILGGLLATSCSVTPEQAVQDMHVPTGTTQVLLTSTADWDATAATVVRLERTAIGWQRIGAPIPARVGRSGLGWGVGHHEAGAGPRKEEGDGRAPAGMFSLGPAFGYAPEPPAGVTFPYRSAGERDYFIDAVDSSTYNTWQRIPDDWPNDPDRLWSSFEHMRRDDDAYEYGIVVGHNTADRIPGRGSAIFVHVWSAPENATSGCTAMAREDLLTVLRWLRPDTAPWLIQAPESELGRLRIARQP